VLPDFAEFRIRKWLRIRLSWHNSNKRVSLSFKLRASHR